MTEHAETAGASPAEELELLKKRALTLGITFSPRIGVDALRAKVQAKLDGTDVAAEDEDGEDGEKPEPAVRKTRAEIEQETRDRVQREAMKLVRCRVHNLNPAKNDLTGEIFTVGNKFLGTVRRMIPYGADTHIEQVLYDDLVARQYQHIASREKNGKIDVATRLVPEFNIEVLDPLTPEELQELALQQAAAERLGATHTVDSSERDAVEAIRELTGGHGADVVIDAVGVAETFRQAFEARDLAGRLVLVGVPNPGTELTLDLADVFSHGGSVRPAWYGDCLPTRDFPMLVDQYRLGRLDLDAFVTERTDLEHINEAFQKMADGAVLRSVVDLPGGGA